MKPIVISGFDSIVSLLKVAKFYSVDFHLCSFTHSVSARIRIEESFMPEFCISPASIFSVTFPDSSNPAFIFKLRSIYPSELQLLLSLSSL